MDPEFLNGFPERTLVLAAHPDDEAIGAAATLALSDSCRVAHLTRGVPERRSLWPRALALTKEDYARARADETRSALALVNVRPEDIHELGGTDGEAIEELVPLTLGLVDLLRELRPPMVVTHPYEGGHPDHDAAAVASHAAVALLRDREGWAPALVEMTSYHAWQGTFVANAFLPREGAVHTRTLTQEERALKQRVIDAYVTQRETLAAFTPTVESFRVAPRYEFQAPPHDGPLWYERQGWARGDRWRRSCAHALAALRLEGASWH